MDTQSDSELLKCGHTGNAEPALASSTNRRLQRCHLLMHDIVLKHYNGVALACFAFPKWKSTVESAET